MPGFESQSLDRQNPAVERDNVTVWGAIKEVWRVAEEHKTRMTEMEKRIAALEWALPKGLEDSPKEKADPQKEPACNGCLMC